MKSFLLVCMVLFAGQARADQPSMSIEAFFNGANYENLDEICRQFYAPDIKFVDPFGEINGIDAMIKYYKNLYENLISIKFEPVSNFENGQERVFVWKMHLRHKKVGGGDLISVDGVSVVRYQNGKAIYHRDYFDMGAMIYEQIPVLGTIIRFIRERAHGSE